MKNNQIKKTNELILNENEKIESVDIINIDNDTITIENNKVGLFTKEQVEYMLEGLKKRAWNQQSPRHQKWLLNKYSKLLIEWQNQVKNEWIKISPINVSGFYSEIKYIAKQQTQQLISA